MGGRIVGTRVFALLGRRVRFDGWKNSGALGTRVFVVLGRRVRFDWWKYSGD